MIALEDALLALAARACPPQRAGRSTWRSTCPACGSPDALALNFSVAHGLGVLLRCRCSRADVLGALGLEEGRP